MMKIKVIAIRSKVNTKEDLEAAAQASASLHQEPISGLQVQSGIAILTKAYLKCLFDFEQKANTT